MAARSAIDRKKIWASESLGLPLNWITMATVIYGARGSGKTTLGRVFAEEITRAGQRFCAIDLKGDWWGLKSSADGERDGLPVVVFGGDHKDVPLEENAGKFVGETVAGLEQSTIIDLEYFSKGKQVKFLHEFFATLYDKNRAPLLLLLDEAQRYAPQGRTALDPDSAKCLGAVEDLVKLGRKHGIGPVLFTQRGSGLNKEVSELCDLLVAFRTPGPLDQARVRDWLDANTTKAERDLVMGKLAGLPTGTAVFASGHPDLKLFGVFPVRRAKTFDSSATPKIGEERVEPKKLSTPDLTKLRAKMVEAIEREKADDPLELKRQLAEVTKQRDQLTKANLVGKAAKAAPPIAQSVFAIEVPEFKEDDFKLLQDSVTVLKEHVNALELKLKSYRRVMLQTVKEAKTQLARTQSAKLRSAQVLPGRPLTASVEELNDFQSRQRSKPARLSNANGGVKLPKIENLILTTLAQFHPKELTRERLALIIGYHQNSKGYVNGLGALRGRGAVEGMTITEVGFAEVGDYEELPTGPAMLDWWCDNKLTPQQERLVRLIEASGPELTREGLAEAVPCHPNSKGFMNNLGRLRGLGIVEGLQLSQDLR